MKTHLTLFLLSDSTVQSYEPFYFPQTGWGQVFHENFKGSELASETQPQNCSYPQGRAYHLPDLTIENRAIGGRSSRSFLEEGKLAEAAAAMKPGDYVFIQFGHNDATPSRPARYVPAEHFADYLKIYADTCRETGARCVFVTPVARRNCDESAPAAVRAIHTGNDSASTDTGTIHTGGDNSPATVSDPGSRAESTTENPFRISFPEYRAEMIRFARRHHLPLLDLGKKSTDYLNRVGCEESKKLYLHTMPGEYAGAYADGITDNTHLSATGARIYSHMVAELILENEAETLTPLKRFLC